MLPHLPGVPHLHVNRLDAMVDAIYRRNARVIEMQNFTPAYMKGGTYVRTKISWIFLTYGSPLRAREISAISVFTSYFIESRVFFRVFTFYAVHLSLSTRVWIHENPPFERNYIIAKEPKRDKHGASSLSSPKIYRKLITRLISIDRIRGPTRSGKAGHLSHFKNLSKVFFT